jgi:hypothetical protein
VSATSSRSEVATSETLRPLAYVTASSTGARRYLRNGGVQPIRQDRRAIMLTAIPPATWDLARVKALPNRVAQHAIHMPAPQSRDDRSDEHLPTWDWLLGLLLNR